MHSVTADSECVMKPAGAFVGAEYRGWLQRASEAYMQLRRIPCSFSPESPSEFANLSAENLEVQN